MDATINGWTLWDRLTLKRWAVRRIAAMSIAMMHGAVAQAGWSALSAVSSRITKIFDRLAELRLTTYKTWAFELREDLVWEGDQPILAYRRYWDPEANSGWGGFVTDCTTCFYVADWRQIQYEGTVGTKGCAEMRRCKNGWIGVICDLACDPDPDCDYYGDYGYGDYCENYL